MSMSLVDTMKKSSLFHPGLMNADQPKAIYLARSSIVNDKLRIMSIISSILVILLSWPSQGVKIASCTVFTKYTSVWNDQSKGQGLFSLFCLTYVQPRLTLTFVVILHPRFRRYSSSKTGRQRFSSNTRSRVWDRCVPWKELKSGALRISPLLHTKKRIHDCIFLASLLDTSLWLKNGTSSSLTSLSLTIFQHDNLMRLRVHKLL